MGKRKLDYRQLAKLVAKDLAKVIEKYDMYMDQVIDHFSFFLAQEVLKKSKDQLVDSNNFVHSFSRYIMALHIDKKNGINNDF